MHKLPRFFAAFFFISVVASSIGATSAIAASDTDPLRALLLESKEKNRGVAIHAAGTTINGIVVSVDDRYVIARSQQSSRIVIRLDRVDGVSASF